MDVTFLLPISPLQPTHRKQHLKAIPFLVAFGGAGGAFPTAAALLVLAIRINCQQMRANQWQKGGIVVSRCTAENTRWKVYTVPSSPLLCIFRCRHSKAHTYTSTQTDSVTGHFTSVSVWHNTTLNCHNTGARFSRWRFDFHKAVHCLSTDMFKLAFFNPHRRDWL